MPDDKIKIQDTRSNVSSTKKLHSEVDRDKLNSIITESVKEGVNPFTALAIAMKESRFGASRPDYGVDHYPPLEETDTLQKYETLSREVSSWSPEKLFVKTLKNKLDYGKRLGYKDNLHQIQAFNGLGYNPLYKANMKQNPLYAKEIVDIQENVMKKNPTVNELVGEAMRNNMLESLQKNYEPPKFNF